VTARAALDERRANDSRVAGRVEEIRWVEVKVVGRTSSGRAQETKVRQRPGNTADDQPR
jgi:hypothetical protein